MTRYRLVAAVLLVLTPVVFSAAVAQPALNIGPYLQNVSASAATVMWETTEPVVGRVMYGRGDQLNKLAEEVAPATIHELRIEGLAPATMYSYRISWPGYEGEVCRFQTLPPARAKRFRIVAYGDSRTQIEIHRRIADLILAQHPALVINTGDLVDDGKKTELWKPMFFDPLAKVMRAISVFTALGNHERNSEYYYQHLALPGNEAWYSFDCGIAHFVVLDPNQPYQEGSPQYDWLQKELDTVTEPDRWLISVFHEPMYAVHPGRGVNGTRWAYERLFERHAADFVLNGHDHYYMRSQPIGPVRAVDAGARLAPGARYGTVHIIAGGGGAPLYPVAEKPFSAYAKSVYHIVVLDFDGLTVHGQMIDIDGNVIDRFVLQRGKPQPAEEYCAYEPMLWERDLAGTAPKLQVGPDGQVEGDGTIVARSPFPMRVAGDVAWRTPDQWTIGQATNRFAVEPGGELKLQFHVKGQWAKGAALPTATVRITEAEGGLDFRNREFSFTPVRVSAPAEK